MNNLLKDHNHPLIGCLLLSGAIVLLGLLATTLPLNLALIRRPDPSLLAAPDRTTYETFSAIPNQEIDQAIIGEWRRGELEPVHVVGPVGIEMDFFHAYLGPRIGSLRESNPDDHGLSPSLLPWVENDQRVFFVEHPLSGGSAGPSAVPVPDRQRMVWPAAPRFIYRWPP
jgi:hypothetical protein